MIVGGLFKNCSADPAASKETFVGRILLDVGGIAFFRRIVMLFGLPRAVILRHLGITARTFAAIGGRNGRHVARHDLDPYNLWTRESPS
jgi:hypothetical protein